MNAEGTYEPPMTVFPRKRMLPALMRGAPPGPVGACSNSGWMDVDSLEIACLSGWTRVRRGCTII